MYNETRNVMVLKCLKTGECMQMQSNLFQNFSSAWDTFFQHSDISCYKWNWTMKMVR